MPHTLLRLVLTPLAAGAMALAAVTPAFAGPPGSSGPARLALPPVMPAPALRAAVAVKADAPMPLASRCRVVLANGADALAAGATGASHAVRFKREGQERCLTAVSADQEWVTVDLVNDQDQVDVRIAANTTPDPRFAEVHIATKSQSFVLRVTQSAGESAAGGQP